MPPIKITDRAEPAIIPHNRAVIRSRLPPALRVAILVVLTLGIKSALWSFVSNFIPPELGSISKIPADEDVWSLYSPGARLAMHIATVWMTWYCNYDFFDVTALTVLTNAPYAYLLTTFYDISTLTVAAHVNIEVAAIAIPTYLLRPRSNVHNKNVALRNRFLINSFQVQLSNSVLALGVYVVMLWAGLKTELLSVFLVKNFDIPTLEAAHAETPLSIAFKTFTAGIAAKEFLLNPSIASEPHSGAATPEVEFDAATATLPETFKHNAWFFGRRTRSLITQTAVLNAFVFASTVQRCMTIEGTDAWGAVGYSGVWVLANSVVAAWYGWVGDTSTDYEP